MATDVSLKCKCGAVAGTAAQMSPKTCNHLVCHCADCQVFARHLGGEALGPLSGLEIIQMSPGRITFSAGTQHIACLRLSDKGLLRWYTSCCQTLIGATPPTASLPSIGMIRTFIDLSAEEIDLTFGPVAGHVFTKTATGSAQEVAALPKGGPPLWLRMYSIVIGWKLRGDSKRHAFFDGDSGVPIATPNILR